MSMRGNVSIGLATLPYKHISFAYLKQYGEAIIKRLGLTTLSYSFCPFDGAAGAATLSFILKESHMALETYPEHEVLEVTLISCRSFTKKQFINALFYKPITLSVGRKTKRGWQW